MTNLYDILNIEKTATKEEIKKAYRKLAKKYHPDINKEEYASDFFKKVNNAYEILSNPKKRYEYDIKLKNNHKNKNYNYNSLDINVIFEVGIKDSLKGNFIQIFINGHDIKYKLEKDLQQNEKIFFKNKGKCINNDCGDLILNIRIITQDDIIIDKNNIIQKIEIKLNTSIFGKSITVDTIKGYKQITIDEGNQCGTEYIKFKNGLYNYETGEIGNLILKTKVIIPRGTEIDFKLQKKYKKQKLFNKFNLKKYLISKIKFNLDFYYEFKFYKNRIRDKIKKLEINSKITDIASIYYRVKYNIKEFHYNIKRIFNKIKSLFKF